MQANLNILTKTGEVLALCSTADCSKVESSLATLSQKGYKEVTPLPKPIEGKGADSKLEFTIRAESDVEIKPRVKILDFKSLKSGFPRPLYFKCSSASGQTTSVELVVKEGEDDVDQEEFEIICKKKETKTVAQVPGGNSAAFIAGGQVDKLQMDGANVNVIGSQSNHAPATHHYQSDTNCDKRQTRTAQFMADSGGNMTIEQHNTTNTQHVGKQ